MDTPVQDQRSFLTARPVAISMVFLAAVVFGYFSYGRLPVNLMPEMTYPTLTVRTEYPGAAPEEVENDVTRPIEEALGVIGGLRRISSVSRAGVSDVILEFAWGIEMSEAIQDTLEKLDLVFLPDETERPLILRFDPSLDPVMELSLAGRAGSETDEAELRRVRRIEGVAAVRVRGGLEEEVHVRLDDEQLRRTGLSVQNVIDRLRQENINVAGGTLTEGRTEYMVRTLNEYEDLQQMEDTIVATREGRQIRVRDLGQVVWSNKERQITTRTDGRESVQLEVFKEADANIVALAKRVKDRLGDFDPDAPPPEEKAESDEEKPRLDEPSGLVEELYRSEGVVLKMVADRSLFIEGSVNEVRNTAIIGGLLAIVILFLFLRSLKSTAIIAVSIPISLIVTFAPLQLLGVSLNIMSLGGLALGIGMLVDSSIVVLESIFRCREEGDGVAEAAVRGTGEVRMAVIASTLTSIAVFLPMVFVEGVAGQAFGDLGLAVVISLLAALVVALTLIPMLASRTGAPLLSGERTAPPLKPTASWRAFRAQFTEMYRSWARWPRIAWLFLPLVLGTVWLVVRLILGTVFETVGKLFLGFMMLLVIVWQRYLRAPLGHVLEFLTDPPLRLTSAVMDSLGRAYPGTIRWALRHSVAVSFIAIGAMALTALVAVKLDCELLPEVHQGEFTFEVQLPVGTPLEETAAVLTPLEEAILAERDHIEALLLTLGFDPATSQRSDEGEHTARFKLVLDTSDPRVEQAVVARLRRRIEGMPDISARVVRPVLFSFQTPIEVEVHGTDLVELRQKAEEAKEVMVSLSALADVETTQRPGAPEVQIVYDRDQLSRRAQHPDRGPAGARCGEGLRGHALQPRGPSHPHRGAPAGRRPPPGHRRERVPRQPGGREAHTPVLRRRGHAGRGPERGAPRRRTAGGPRTLERGNRLVGGRGPARRGGPVHPDRLAFRHDLLRGGPEPGVGPEPGEPPPRPRPLGLSGLRHHGCPVRVAGAAPRDHAHHSPRLPRHGRHALGPGHQPFGGGLPRHDHVGRHRGEQRHRPRGLHQHPPASGDGAGRGHRHRGVGPVASHPDDHRHHRPRSHPDGPGPG
jgi:HAE1 family hydrophobic/amphiphilic exporter-1